MLGKHTNEFMRAIRNGRFERTDDGRLLLPQSKTFIGGIFGISRNGGPIEVLDNTVVYQGLDYLFNVGGLLHTPMYIAPFANNTAVASTLTAATFASTQGEFTNYVETTRQLWSPPGGGSANGVVTNSAAPATITISTGGQTAVYGAGLVTASAKSATTGYLFCAALATTAKTGLENGETLSFNYTIAATST